MYVALKHLFRENYKFCGDHGFCITGYKSRVYAALDDLSCSSGWADVGNLSAYTAHGLSINKANLILIIGSIFLGILVYWKTIRIDIAKG